MKIHKEELGKVSITIEGKFNPAKIYDRLCLVGDGQFGIYISKKRTPSGTSLSDEIYWQCISNLSQDVKIDYNDFKDYVTNTIQGLTDYVNTLIPSEIINAEEIITRAILCLAKQGALKFGFRIVETEEDLNNLYYAVIGDFVYVIENASYYIFGKDRKYYKIPTIYVGNEEQEDTIWIDTQSDVG